MSKHLAKDSKKRLGKALRLARTAAGLTQEDFGVVSSRTYVSTIERGQNSPTFEKLEALAHALKLHPGTLMLLPYLVDEPAARRSELLELLRRQIDVCLDSAERHRVRHSNAKKVRRP